MSRTISAKKALAAFSMTLVLAFAGLACAPASASASELTAANSTPSVKSTAFRTVSNPAAPKIDACLASGPGKIAVHATKVKYAQGYQFQIARDSKFTKGVKTRKVKAYGTTFTGLAKGKKYYVRARAYQTKTDLCTKWSGKKSTKSGIAYNKSKITGTWKLVGSNNAELSDNIDVMRAYGYCIKITFNKKGKIITKSTFDGSTSSSGKWVATSKTAGYEYSDYKKASTISLKKGKITWTDKRTGVRMTLVKA